MPNSVANALEPVAGGVAHLGVALAPGSSVAELAGGSSLNSPTITDDKTDNRLDWEADEERETQAATARAPRVGFVPRQWIDPPRESLPPRLLWPYVLGIGGLHVAALVGFTPWFFTWTGVVVMFASLYLFNTLGINLCYHRLLTHQGFKVPKWFERVLTTLGVLCLQDTPGRWVAIHRAHHKHSDEQPDPHSPWVSMFWGHMGWLIYENREFSRVATYERYARDILRDPYYLWMERGIRWFWMYLGLVAVYYGVGFGVGWLLEGTLAGAVTFGLSITIWGVIIRTVFAWHITWAVNSLSHRYGYRNYETDENSTNNWFVALVSNGEGWHNNHHADQRSAAHGHRWWEFDVTWLTIRFLELIGVARDVVRPRAQAGPPMRVRPK